MEKLRHIRKIYWILIGLSFLGGLINITIHQPLLGFIAVSATIVVWVLVFRRGNLQKIRDGNLLRNLRRILMYLVVVLSVIAVVALVIAIFRH